MTATNAGTNARSSPNPGAAPDLGTIDDVFALDGELMMGHPGRSVVRLEIDGRTYYLKRYWFTPARFFKRFVRLGLHELTMIDWLDANGFAAPVVVDRGTGGIGGFRARLYFLMQEVPDELPLERYWRRHKAEADALLVALARYAALLHEAGFHHRDFSERHIFIGRTADGYTFRLIDLERASVTRPDDAKAAADLKTLSASVSDDSLRAYLCKNFLDVYLSARTTPPANFHQRFAQAKATKTFE